MGRIKDTQKYIYDNNITGEDYLIGSDFESNGKTKNYKLSSLGDYFAQYINSQSDSTYFHEQATPSDVWVVNHNMNKYPTPLIQDENGETIITDIEYISLNIVHIIFGRPTAGTGTFN